MAEQQKKVGKLELYSYIINRNTKKIDEIINTTWDIRNSIRELERSKKSRLDILSEYLEEDCVLGCNNKWLEAAINTIQNNDIDVNSFASAVKLLLEKGRGKMETYEPQDS